MMCMYRRGGVEETDENILSLALGDHAIIEVGTYDPPMEQMHS